MQLWLITRDEDDCSWEEACGFVIRAETEQIARELAATQKGDEGAKAWLSSDYSHCRPLPQVGECCIVIRDFKYA